MKRRILIFVLIVQLILPACLAGEHVFTDDLGREVRAGKTVRAAALLGSFAQIWMLAGGEVCASADDAWDDLQLDMPADAVNLGNTKQMSLELLLSSEPDLILASTNTRQHMEWLDTLDACGIPSAYFDVAGFEDYLRVLDVCTTLTGRRDLYEKYGTDVQESIESVLEHSRRRIEKQGAPTVLCLVASASAVYAKNSEGNVLGCMLKRLGCENIADSDSMLLEQLSIEHILTADPDYIFIVQRGDDAQGMHAYVQRYLLEHPIWNKLSAVREERVYFMDKNLFNLKPNHRWGEAYGILEGLLSDEEA